MMLVLDCSFSGLSLALMEGGAVLAETRSPTPRSSDILMPKLQEMLQTSGKTPADIRHVALTVGPGSFTGIRIGLAVAEAFRITNPGLAITALSTLQALALQTVEEIHPPTPFTVLLDAAGGTAYHQTFSPTGQPLTESAVSPLADILKEPQGGMRIAAGSLLLPVLPAHTIATLNPRILAEMAQNPAFHLPPQPVYLKPLTYKKAGG